MAREKKQEVKLPFALWKVGTEEFKLKLTVGEIERLERAYGQMNLLNPFLQSENGTLPPLTYTIDILHASLQKFHHGYSRTDTLNLYDDYIEDGGNYTQLIPVLLEIFKASGFFPR